ncbi:MAG TPA: aminotransferase class V-fold PLP-dependent enzyme [Gaiellaceae bacterium]|nr:aminotransferase class V-fold PLP-dependent enzyme [Gaiellaceae bacterium]
MDGADRHAPIGLDAEDFRRLGHGLVDDIADFLRTLPERPVAPGRSADEVRDALRGGSLPEQGTPADELLAEAARLLFEHSTFNGHPRFLAYITASASPIGALGDLLAAAVNPNVSGWALSPVATEVEAQTVRWIAELLGYPADCGGLLVSGGNMANFVGFLAARRARAPFNVRTEGMAACDENGPLRVYVSAETHTWIEKAADLFGLGTDAIRWIEVDGDRRMLVPALQEAIAADRAAGAAPLLVVGTAGSVSTGAIDPLREVAALCRDEDIWLHVDGAYGAPAAVLPDAPADLKALAEADSVAIDPHKWLYAPLEAGCALVRDPQALLEAFTYRPPYYAFDEGADSPISYVDYGPQNSRGFRALKVWLGLRQVGRDGYVRMISDDIALARELHRLASEDPELEAWTTSLSITTFRYIPPDVEPGTPETEEYLNALNQELRDRLERGGETYVSNAVVGDTYLLRACVVNFRTTAADIAALPEIVKRVGAEVHADQNPLRAA